MKNTDQLEDSLRQKKLRITNARKVIYQILQESDCALSPRDVCEHVKKNTGLRADSASVYRNLTLFSDIGLTHKLQSGKYSVCQHEDEHHHHDHDHMHIVATCASCGKTQEVPAHDPKLCKIANGFKKYMKDFSTFSGITLVGSCQTCSELT